MIAAITVVIYVMTRIGSAVSIENGQFAWDEKHGVTLDHINVNVQKGSLIAVVGTVGSGKSSLLAAMLGEMQKLGGSVNTVVCTK